VQGPAIASRHRVRSVLLVSELPLWKVRTVAHDKGSRTSVVLARILFKEFYGTRPDFRAAEPDLPGMLATSDAALIIGDGALRFMERNEIPRIESQKTMVRHGAEPLQVFDLLERWKFLTGLPFLFAFWACRPGFKDRAVVTALNDSRDFGVRSIPAIAERYAEKLQLGKEFLQEYLQENVHYYMDSDCIEGLRLFYQKAASIGALRSVRGLEFL
jgi:chorismate dehydratase